MSTPITMKIDRQELPHPRSTTPAATSSPGTLPDSAASTARDLEEKLLGYSMANELAGAFYDEEYSVQMLDLGMPKEASRLRLVMGWARTVVDVLAERLEPLAWAHPDIDRDDAAELWEDSGAASAIPQAIIDHLVYGMGFLSATAGDVAAGEPRVLVRAHSATSTTADVCPRTGYVRSALTLHDEKTATLWLPTAIVEMHRSAKEKTWEVRHVAENRLGAVPMVAIPNAPRAGRPGGRSEITPAIRSALASATRALIAMDVNREFFAIPHRYLIGLSGNLKNPDGSLLETWKLAARAMLKIPYPEDGGDIQVGEFSQVRAGPFLEQMEGLAKITASEAAVPSMYLGVETANPTSADAARMAESRLVRRSRARITAMSPMLNRLGLFALAIDGGTALADTPRPTTAFADPATAAFSADADAWAKLDGAGLFVTGNPVIWRRMGFTEAEIADLTRHRDELAPLMRAKGLDAHLDRMADAYDPADDDLQAAP